MRRLFLRLLVALAIVTSTGASATVVSLGSVDTVTPFSNGASLALTGGGAMRIEFLQRGVIHVEATPPGGVSLATGAVLAQTAASGTAEVYQDASSVVVRQAGLTAIIGKHPLQLVLFRADGSVISADLPGGNLFDATSGTVVVVKSARADEHFFGMGLAGGTLDRRGRQLMMKNTDSAAYDELTNPLYSSTPFFYGNVGGQTYGLYFDNPSVASFDFAMSSPDLVSIAAVGGTLNYYVLAGPEPADVAYAFAGLTGTTPRPPRWATGYLQAHFGYASAAQVLSLANEFRTLQIPCDAFFLDLDYTDRLFSMTWNPTAWPDPVSFNNEMASLGFARVNILEPSITVFDPLWAYAAGSGFLVDDSSGNPYIADIWMGSVSYFDFTKQAARDFFRSALTLFLSTGVSGIWADLNEPAANTMPYAVFDFDGQPRYEYTTRNIYALTEVQVLHDALAQAQPGIRPFIVSRSGFTGIQRYAANWSGDTNSTFDSLRVQVEIAASMGLSGQNFFGADIGGFLGAPNAELFVRWLQFGSATPFMRNHSTNTSPPREPWQFGEPYTSVAKSTIEWRYRLMPYLSSLFAQTEAQGTPVLSPTFFQFPADANTATQNGEYLLGPALLVAPVVTEGAITRTLYLPSGTSWIDYNTGVAYAGGQQVTIPAPLQVLPMLARAGSIIPMGPIRQYAAEVVDDYLLLDVFGGANGSFTLVEDDGTTTQYKLGNERQTTLSWTETATSSTLTVGTATGTLAAATRPWYVQVRQWPAVPKAVVADGVTLLATSAFTSEGGWSYDPASGIVLIRTPGSAPPQSVRIDH